ncbi:MAG TPA: substrate-binding domain-containing protein [Burkholderiales bacterium]|nr:substrate-binding domain-containing protein [Burkholderiales bacterium]
MSRAIKVFASNSIRAVMGELAPQFERANDCKIAISYDPAKVMLARIQKGETADLAILGSGAIDELVKQGKISAGSRRVLARCRVGVAVLAGKPRPDISSVEAFKRTLLGAKSVAYTQEGASGMHFAGLIERLGIAEQVKAKAVRQPGGLIGELVAAGKAEIAIQQIPELMAVAGIELVGPLPAEIQLVTVSSAGIFAGTKQAEAAQSFIRFLVTPAAARVMKTKGLEPMAQDSDG